MITELSIHAGEGSTIIIRGVIKDETGATMTPTMLRWTLTDGDNHIVNSRDEEAIDPPSGTIYIVLTNLDLRIGGGLSGVRRYVLLEGTYDSQDYGSGLWLREEVVFDIDDYIHVSAA